MTIRMLFIEMHLYFSLKSQQNDNPKITLSSDLILEFLK